MKNAVRAFCRVALILAYAQVSSWAGGPIGGSVVGGPQNATITGEGTSLTTINQSANQAVINWQQFSIGAGDTVKFIQPSATAIALNRVLSGNPTQIYGLLQANGRVIVINPNGIMVGAGGTVDTKGFVASTLDVPDNSFLSGGPMLFSGPSTAAIHNQGTIQALGGDVFLIANTVDNSGKISAPQGTVGLAAGSAVELVQSGNERLSVLAGNPAGSAAVGVNNSGTIAAASAELKAAGGNIYALAINNGGVVRATGIVNENGHIYLRATGGNIQNTGTLAARNADGSGGAVVVDGGHNAAAPATVVNSGTIDASGNAAGATGGTVELLGDNVGLFDNALVDVSGDAGGGTALIGGDLHGANAAIQDAEHTFIGQNALIDANALGRGNGGEIVVWSDGVTRDFGSLSAQGGAAGGDGGFAEVSSKGVLDFDGPVNLGAPSGTGGTLLLDPLNITISTAVAANTTGFNPGTDNTEAFADDSGLNSVFQLTGNPATSSFGGVGNGATILLEADNNITVANAFNIATETGNNDVSLSLRAGNNISINAPVTASGAGTISLSANDNGGGTATGTGAISFGAAGSLTTAGQTIDLTGQNVTIGGLGINTTGAANNPGGNVTASASATGTLALNAPVIAEGGAATAAGDAGGNVDLTGGTVTTGAGGSVNTSGSAATAGSGGQAGTITFASTGSLATGNLTADGGTGVGFAGGNAADISLSAGTGITLNNNLTALGGAGTSSGSAAVVSFNTTSGGVTQTSGAISSGGLELIGSGTFNITDAGNSVGTLAASADGAITYVDANTLTVGTVTGLALVNGIISTGNAINISTVNAPLTIDKTVDAGAGSATLAAGSSGADNLLTVAPGVTVHGAAGVTLAADNMTIDPTASINAGTATVTLEQFENGTKINVGGANGVATLGLSASELGTVTGGVLQIGNGNSGALTVTAPIAPATTLSLQSGSTITQNPGATITDGTLILQGGTTVTLTQANQVNALQVAGAGGIIQFTDAAANLDLQGINAAGQTVTLNGNTVNTLSESSGIITAGHLNLNNWAATTLNQPNQAAILQVTGANGAFQFTTGGTLDVQGIADAGQTVTLASSGSPTINESTGVINANELDLNSLATTTLNRPNTVNVLKVSGLTATLQFTDANNLDVQGINGPGQTVTLSGSSSPLLGQSIGTIVLGQLFLSGWGATTLNQPNVVDHFQVTSGTGAIQFTDNQNLDVLGIGAAGQTVTLTAGGADMLSETLPNIITAGRLNLVNWGATTLNQANQVAVLNVTGATGSFQFETGGALDVQGINDPTQTITLSGTGAGSTITESTGLINSQEVDLNTLGTTTLNQPNTVSVLKISGAAGTTQFTDGLNLDVQGIGATGQTVGLTAAFGGTLMQSVGTITAGQLDLAGWSLVTLNNANQTAVLKVTGDTGPLQYTTAAPTLDIQGIADPGETVILAGGGHALTESAGSINALELDLNSFGATTLNQGNQVGVLKVAGATGTLQFTDAQNLDVEGVADPGQAVTLAATGDNNQLTVGSATSVTGSSVTLAGDRINLVGTVNTPGIATIHESTAGRQINVGTDDINAPTLSGGAMGLTMAELNNVNAATLRVGDANSGNTTVTAPIAPATFGTLSLLSGAVVGENAAGLITINNLAAQAVSAIGLLTANQVGTFAANSAGSIQFNNSTSFSVGTEDGINGVSSGSTISLTADTGLLTVNQKVMSPAGVTLTANDMDIAAPVSSGGLNTVFQPFNVGISDNFGPPIAGDLNLSQTELNEVTANILQVGNNNSGAPIGATLVTAPGTVHQLVILGANTSITILSQQLAALSAVEIPAPKLDVAEFTSASLSLDEASKILPAGAIGTIWLQLPLPHEKHPTYEVENVSKWTSGPVAAVGTTTGPQTPR